MFIVITTPRYQAVTVKSLGPTNTKPARLRVATSDGAFSATYSRHAFEKDPHAEALRKFLNTLPDAWRRLNWCGAFTDADTCVFIATSRVTEV